MCNAMPPNASSIDIIISKVLLTEAFLNILKKTPNYDRSHVDEKQVTEEKATIIFRHSPLLSLIQKDVGSGRGQLCLNTGEIKSEDIVRGLSL